MPRAHDLGGRPGLGPVPVEDDEAVFDAPWEARMLALQRTMGYTRAWNIDASRASQETLPAYARVSYYHRWALGVKQNALRRGLLDEDEVRAARVLRPGPALPRTMRRADIGNAFARGNFARPTGSPPRFRAGQAVTTIAIAHESHTRLPAYAQRKRGTVEAIRGCHVFPDSNAIGAGEQPQWLYAVVFEAAELWGPEADPASRVSIEAFESYLEAA